MGLGFEGLGWEIQNDRFIGKVHFPFSLSIYLFLFLLRGWSRGGYSNCGV
jgi:hypothetical protein